ncbi:TPA: hypothetical protein OEJ39_002013 [Escherichia coli]|nr:hypothetical protein [Escherichia coli]
MRKNRNIKNNLMIYMNNSTNAAIALSVVVEAMQNTDNKKKHEDCVAALNFLSDEMYARCMAVDDFLEDEDLDEMMSNKDIYELLAARKKTALQR